MARTPKHSLRAPVPHEARRLLASAAALTRFHPDQTAEIAHAKHRAAVIALEDHIKRLTELGPTPLTIADRERLAALLRNTDGAA